MRERRPVRLAMWSGPRNISTAMMRAWGNRPDTFVWDEPLYAHYLHATGIEHPGRAEVIAHGEADWRKVVERLTGPVPSGKSIFYQKHMAHHLLPGMDRAWIDGLDNCFLIRDPADMLASLARFLPSPDLRDTGLAQQVEIFERVRAATGGVPPVIDARDVREDPERILRKLCDALAVEFTAAMLRWPPGPRPWDGVWGKHWYAAVERSTSFLPYAPRLEMLPAGLESVHAQCADLYDRLHRHRIR